MDYESRRTIQALLPQEGKLTVNVHSALSLLPIAPLCRSDRHPAAEQLSTQSPRRLAPSQHLQKDRFLGTTPVSSQRLWSPPFGGAFPSSTFNWRVPASAGASEHLQSEGSWSLRGRLAGPRDKTESSPSPHQLLPSPCPCLPKPGHR